MTTEHPLVSFRRTAGLSQGDLAERVGCTRWFINRIERGHRSPSVSMSRRMVEVSDGILSLEQLRPDIFTPEGVAA